ncbi:MAG: hypothetical protein KDA61_18100 [Planctomycetales bacterium]|nr:hypothetical protein [Planctomycetales bacterium]
MTRNGSVYLAVVGAATIVASIALVASYTYRLELLGRRGMASRRLAECAARSGLEAALAILNDTPNWRSTYGNGVDQPASGWVALYDSGEYRWQVLDPRDGDLTDDDSETVVLRCQGRSGTALAVESVQLEPRGSALDCLGVSWYNAGNLVVPAYIQVTTDQVVASGGNLTVNSNGTLNGSAEAVGAISGNVTGSSTPGAAARRLPGASAFDYYLSIGTRIQASDLPSTFGIPTLNNVVLSPNHNPYGALNPAGVYVLDCEGKYISIGNCRVLGTLVAINVGTAHVEVNFSTRWDAFISGFPALLVDGKLQFRMSSQPLNESTLGVNLNPVGAPYEGVEDGDQVDTYPSEINGLCYASGSIALAWQMDQTQVRGVLASPSCSIMSRLNVTYDGSYLTAPPPGFAHGDELQVIPGSWTRQAAP